MFKKFFFLVAIFAAFISGCAVAPIAAAPAAPVVVDVAIVANPITLPIALAVVGASTLEESVAAVSDAGGCTPALGVNGTPEMMYQVGCSEQLHASNDGSMDKIRSRIQAAKNIEGKTPQKCLLRPEDGAVLLVFAVQYAGSHNRYQSAGFIYNPQMVDRSTFMGFDKPPEKIKKPEFSQEIDVNSSECQGGLQTMNSIIGVLKSAASW